MGVGVCVYGGVFLRKRYTVYNRDIRCSARDFSVTRTVTRGPKTLQVSDSKGFGPLREAVEKPEPLL